MMSTEASLLSNEVQIEMLRQAIEQSTSGFFCCDCMDGMKAIPDKYFDLAIVDPPYGIGATRFNNGAGLKDHAQGSTALKARQNRFHGAGKLHDRVLNRSNLDWDNEPPKHEYFEELFRVSRNQIIWGGNYFDLPPTRGIVVWDKKQPWENFSQVEYAWTSFDAPAALFSYRSTNEKNKFHPTQKPLDLYRFLIRRFAEPGDVILDTHAGSATSLIACRETGHRYIGFEIDPEYYEKAKARLDAAESQATIFDYL